MFQWDLSECGILVLQVIFFVFVKHKVLSNEIKNPPRLIKLILQEEGLDLLDKHVLKAVVSDLLLGVAEIKFCKG